MQRGRHAGEIVARLTEAERRVLERLMLGETNKEIAAALQCSPRTVEFHLAHVFSKVGVEGRGRLMAAIANGGVRTNPLSPLAGATRSGEGDPVATHRAQPESTGPAAPRLRRLR